MCFAVIAHTLAFKMWQKKNEHLILHSLACTGKKQLPGFKDIKDIFVTSLVLLCCRKQPLEGSSRKSWLQPAGNFTRKQLASGNNVFVKTEMFWEAESLNPCWTQEVDLQRMDARHGGPGSHQETAVLLMAGAGETPWASLCSGRAGGLGTPPTPGQEGPLRGCPATPGHGWHTWSPARLCLLLAVEAELMAALSHFHNYWIFPEIFFYPQDFLFKNITFRICIFPTAGKTIFTKLPQIYQNVYSICFMALGICYSIHPPPDYCENLLCLR